MRSRPALLGVSDGIVAASPVSASPDGAAPCSGWIATAVCDATAAPFGRVWSVVTEGSSCHTRGVVDCRLASRPWSRGAYLKARVCNIEELSCPNSSQRAEDLTLKLRILRQRRRDEALAAGIPAGKVVERVATFATGTPIANSLGELWVMQSYLRPDLLRAAGVEDLGDWGAAFTATVTTVEVNSTGTRLRPVTRVGKFTNLPELLALSSAYSDVVTRDQVPVALPELATGQRRIISLQPDVEVTDFIADLGYRADHPDHGLRRGRPRTRRRWWPTTRRRHRCRGYAYPRVTGLRRTAHRHRRTHRRHGTPNTGAHHRESSRMIDTLPTPAPG